MNPIHSTAVLAGQCAVAAFALLLCAPEPAVAQDGGSEAALVESIAIEGGTFLPFFLDDTTSAVEVSPFRLDVSPVTNAQFAAFVETEPRWAPGAPPEIFASPTYLSHWESLSTDQVANDPTLQNQPVTHVSYFAAIAYCESVGGRLPTEAEWELVGNASLTEFEGQDDPDHIRRVLAWYERPLSGELASVGSTEANAWGVHDMHQLVWEWVFDFNASTVSAGSRGSDGFDGFFCGGAAVNARDASDYAAFMRYAFRSSLTGRYVSPSLGFRCAYPN